MKWKAYRICYFYNIIICTGITCFGLYNDLQSSRFDPFVLIIYGGLTSGLAKNLLSWKMKASIDKAEIVSQSSAVIFYILWVINLAYTIALMYLAYDAITSEGFRLEGRDLLNTILLWAFLLVTLTSVYTLIFDIPLARKATRVPDLSHELLSDYNKEAV